MIDEARSKYFRGLRSRARMTRRLLAHAADIDPSYLTLIERDGTAPRPAIAERIVRALIAHGVPEPAATRWLILCGHIPPRVIDGYPGLLTLFLEAFAAPVREQARIAQALEGVLRTVEVRA